MSQREPPVCRPGKSFPLGATLAAGGANFSVFSKHGATAQLLLFDDLDAPTPSRVIDLASSLPALYGPRPHQ
jgi:pullulanase/glycogen debranching enzyme